MAHDDERWMRAALRLARLSEGRTRPNPPVGAVVVRNGRCVGRGRHRKAGGPHAEVEALDRAGHKARGATLYVTLEPCCTYGRTPPCTNRILQSGVARVVAGIRDPNPRHAGRGFTWLRRQGIAVDEGVCPDEALALIEPFATWIRAGRPFVTLKLAMSLDGKIADARGRSRWITGPTARAMVKRMRARSDVVLVGRNTAVKDDPGLLCDANPALWRAVADTRGRTPPSARMFRDGHADRTIVLTTAACPAARRRAYETAGAMVTICRPARGGLSLPHAMRRLAEMGFLRVLCEGGGELAGALLKDGLADEIALFMAPLALGGASAPPAFALGNGWALPAAPRFRVTALRRMGADVWVLLRPGGRRDVHRLD